jgi:hypothetical protein
MAYTPGPRELQLRAMREAKAIKKPTKADLRSKVAKIKPMTRKGGKRGR